MQHDSAMLTHLLPACYAPRHTHLKVLLIYLLIYQKLNANAPLQHAMSYLLWWFCLYGQHILWPHVQAAHQLHGLRGVVFQHVLFGNAAGVKSLQLLIERQQCWVVNHQHAVTVGGQLLQINPECFAILKLV